MGVSVTRQMMARAKQELEESGVPVHSPIEGYIDFDEQIIRVHGKTIPLGELDIYLKAHEEMKESSIYVNVDLSPENIMDARGRLSQEPTSQPPLNAEFLLHLLLRHDEHDAIIGDLIERYGKKCARLGTRRANFWFYAEVFWTALPLIKRTLLKLSGMMSLAEFVRRHIS